MAVIKAGWRSSTRPPKTPRSPYPASCASCAECSPERGSDVTLGWRRHEGTIALSGKAERWDCLKAIRRTAAPKGRLFDSPGRQPWVLYVARTQSPEGAKPRDVSPLQG